MKKMILNLLPDFISIGVHVSIEFLVSPKIGCLKGTILGTDIDPAVMFLNKASNFLILS